MYLSISICISLYIYIHMYIYLLYAYSSFSAVIGQIMITWPPYEINIGVQYHFPTSCQVHVLNSQLELLIKRNPTEMNWYKELRRVWASCKILIRKNTNYITFIKDKTHFQIKWINHYISKTNACDFFRYLWVFYCDITELTKEVITA